MFERDERQSLAAYFPWDDQSLGGEFLLCVDEGSMTSDFAVLLAIFKQLRLGECVDVVCAHKPRRHYELALRRQGLDVDTLLSKSQLTFMEPNLTVTDECSSSSCSWYFEMKQIGDEDKGEGSGLWCRSLKNNGGSDISSTSGMVLSLDAVLQDYLERVESGQRSSSLVIDDLDSLMMLCGTMSGCVDLISRVMGFSALNKTALICGCSNLFNVLGTNPTMLREGGSLSEYCRYLATIIARVVPLQSGFSSDSHGLIQVCHRLRKRTLQFKLSDSGVTCSLIGDHFN